MPIPTVIIDDEPLARERIQTLLADHPDFEVLAECSDGHQGIETIKEHAPKLIFLDIQMPKINGFEVTEQVRADPELNSVKIILLTAKGQESDREVGKTAGANDYMTKPFSPTKILERAREVLGS